MSAISRALLLFSPLFLFTVAGSLYMPERRPVPDSGFSPATAPELPPLPAWALARLPDFSVYTDTTEKKAAFFSFLYPRIALANTRILLERYYLLQLEARDSLSAPDRAWLDQQARRFRVETVTGRAEQIQALKKRLDIIPPSLILAQAANESAWGTSRFAVMGNNLFGQWCFSMGCGLVPRQRSAGASHEVARFSSPYHSVMAYIENLNRHPGYRTLRDIRLQNRNARVSLSGLAMAEGLQSYSERGETYVKEIQSMIHYNNLEFYDRAFQESIQDGDPGHLLQLAQTTAAEQLLPAPVSHENQPARG